MKTVKEYIRTLIPFIGVNPDRLMELIEKVRMEFHMFDKDQEIFSTGMKANNLILLIDGHVVMEREPVEGVRVSWKVTEGHPLDLPAMYGLTQSHGLTARALGPSRLVSIDKDQFRLLCEKEPIIQLNLINNLGRAASVPPSLRAETTLGLWFESLSRWGGTKDVRIDVSLTRLSDLLSISHDSLRNQLRNLHNRGEIKWLPDEEAMIIPHCSF